jgi:hypothetical protein
MAENGESVWTPEQRAYWEYSNQYPGFSGTYEFDSARGKQRSSTRSPPNGSNSICTCGSRMSAGLDRRAAFSFSRCPRQTMMTNVKNG